ncbi:MAG: patatin-like phospholipase family protein, partial [Acidobacteriota bacterium]
MPSSQSEYPITLAEVLYEELETTAPSLNVTDGEVVGVVAKLKIIKELRTEDQLTKICAQEKIKIDPAAETLFDKIWDCRKQLSKNLVPTLYKIIRELPETRSALCLSGGGVRSAVFNLGILQGLARCKLLEKFDYMSTVSGGGFIGGWLSAWIRRENRSVTDVANMLAKSPDEPLKPEPSPLYKLRIYANYLTPKKGLLSVDTWTLAAIYARNLLLNWLVFVPVIMALLMLPRIWAAFVRSPYLDKPFVFHLNEPFLSYLSPRFFLIVGFATA